jgi:radical SAM superfamily enzyme YgiQ (UPF0313 family)
MGRPSSILCIEPKTPNLNEYSAFIGYFPLLGPVGMATQLKQNGYNVSVVDENITPILKSDYRRNNVIIITILTTTAPRAYEIAIAYRKENPQGRVLIGGPHATFMPEEALRFADNVGRFEGEKIIEGMVLGDYKRGTVVDGSPVQNLEDIPFPDLSLIRGYKKKLAPVWGTRGCPHDCDFCSVTGIYGRKQRRLPIENVVEQFRRGRDAKNLFAYDDNIAANRKWMKGLLERLIEEKFDTYWINQVRSEVGKDDELLELLQKAYCSTVCVGYESEDPGKLKEYGKGKSLSARESVEGFHKHKIAVQGMFIFDELTDYLSLPVDYLQISILTPIPGSELFERVRKNNLFIDGMNPLENPKWWRYFDGGHVVYHDPLNRGKQESLEKLIEIQKRVVEILTDFYSFGNIFKKKKLKGGIDWKRAPFWLIAQKARRQKRGYVDFLKKLKNKGNQT